MIRIKMSCYLKFDIDGDITDGEIDRHSAEKMLHTVLTDGTKHITNTDFVDGKIMHISSWER